MLHHPLAVVVGKTPLYLAGRVAYFSQAPGHVIAVAGQHFTTLIGIQTLDARQLALFPNQFNLHQI
ncbi:hypothetical protein [Pseudomonas sp. 25 E 4]|nr:hypothetical protein [Pseudomonas sp. 25 E 4]